ncbi:TolC family protein [Prodigiosinella confusarubida]|uniref:TolC family protein n=1 Tax=Serratia sp. (strain ATCC 39006) TaxID=104623 RepID=A0A2I5THT8_SERS3|nr:TolC family protein [Serratia sp. ATCC 39006]AUG99815.1 TolC family protein [Serratia sp. ATCC 39006]AUH04134.1 TolC family protein [Serratia sp. ATCC 39006]
MNKCPKILSISVVALVISGCTVSTKPINKTESLRRANADLSIMFSHQEPVTGPITLHDAMARALKYNLEARVKVMEHALSQNQLDLASFDMLPRLAAEAGYVTRSNVSASSSRSVETGSQSLEPSTSQDKTRRVADLTMVWNVLDFGVSYVTAQQHSDQRWIADERRRKVVHTIVQDVQSAYWRAVAAERLLSRIDALIDRVNMARENSQKMTTQKVGDLVEAYTYQRALLDATRQLEEQRRALSLAKTELATLMNLPLGTQYVLALPDENQMPEPALHVDFNRLEKAALVNRPELREQDYQVRISAAETRKTLLRMLPGLEMSVGGNYDSNSFLVNQSWADAGIKVTWNLFNLFSGPTAHRVAKAGEAVAEARRQAMSMAVMAQLYVARANFSEAQRQYRTGRELQKLDSKILEQLRNRYKAGSIGELQLIQGELNAVNTSLRNDLAYAELRNAYSQIFVTVGLDPLADSKGLNDIASVSRSLDKTEKNWAAGNIAM